MAAKEKTCTLPAMFDVAESPRIQLPKKEDGTIFWMPLQLMAISVYQASQSSLFGHLYKFDE